MCDKRGEPCHPVCGGGGCGVCGAEQSCENGAVKKAENALDLARKAEELLTIKERNATDLLSKVSIARDLQKFLEFLDFVLSCDSFESCSN